MLEARLGGMREVKASSPPSPSTGSERLWMVLCTKSRQEKVVANYLESRQFEHYLPLIDRVSYKGGRKFSSRVPLFPGYVFLNGTAMQRYAAVDTGRVFQVLPVNDQRRFEHELHQIHLAMAKDATLERYPFAVVGRRCRVTKGPLMGVEGVIASRDQRNRLVLSIDVLGRGAALDIDLDLVEPID